MAGTRGVTRWIGLAGVAGATLVVGGLVGRLAWTALASLAMVGLPGFLAWILAVSIVMTIHAARQADRMKGTAIAR